MRLKQKSKTKLVTTRTIESVSCGKFVLGGNSRSTKRSHTEPTSRFNQLLGSKDIQTCLDFILESLPLQNKSIFKDIEALHMQDHRCRYDRLA